MHRVQNDKAKNTKTSGNLPHQPDQLLGYSWTNICYSEGVQSLIQLFCTFFFDSSYFFIRETCSVESNPLLEAADECINLQK